MKLETIYSTLSLVILCFTALLFINCSNPYGPGYYDDDEDDIETGNKYLLTTIYENEDRDGDNLVVNTRIARVKCTNPECNHDFFVPFSCKQFLFCPCCSQKRTLLFGEYLTDKVLLRLPHKFFTFTLPKLLICSAGRTPDSPSMQA